MAKEKDPWFVIERSDALATLLLTAQPGVKVVSKRERDGVFDLFLGVDGHAALPTQLFVVQVKGTVSADPADWMQNVEQLFWPAGRQVYLPTCVFVVDVRENTISYAWVTEPTAETNAAKLTYHDTPSFHPLTAAAVADIISRVKAYYDVFPKQLLATG